MTRDIRLARARAALWSLLLVTLPVAGAPARADVQPGDVITQDNMQKADGLLCPTQEYFLKHGMTMNIVPYQRYEWPNVYKDATERNAAQVRLSPDGREILNYVAGAPFPEIDPKDPQAAYKIMWNNEHPPWWTDNLGAAWVMQMVSAQGRVERQFGSRFWRRMRWDGRLRMDPKPTLPHDPPITYTEGWGPLSMPNDLKGAGVMNIRYSPRDVPDDSYMYIPELRRVRRLSMANRSDSFWGTDIDIDSVWGFNAKIAFWTFRLLADKQMLVSAHSGKYGSDGFCAAADTGGGVRTFAPCVNWEKRRVYVIEGTPTGYGEQYACSKRVMYIDAEFYNMNFQECYDQSGQLWKAWYMVFDLSKKPNPQSPRNYEEEELFTPFGGMVDMQTDHASRWDCGAQYPGNFNVWEKQYDWYFHEDMPWNNPDVFTVNDLIRNGRD